jgi:hypothetical protein
VSRDIFSYFRQNFFQFLPLFCPLLSIKSNKNLFGSTRFHTLSQIKLILAGLGFHIKLQMIKMKNVTPHGRGGVSHRVIKVSRII